MFVWMWLACAPEEEVDPDDDRDGVVASADCDDADPFVYPGAMERCNGRDDDCDGVVDGEGASGATRWYVDDDGDGFGTRASGETSCEPLPGRVALQGDCDDADPAVHPGLRDTCDGVDTDCDGKVDSDPDQIVYVDRDLDGFAGAEAVSGCVGGVLHDAPTDCDDAAAEVFPGAEERCNGIDDDCDGQADDADPEGPTDPTRWYVDLDLDGFGDEAWFEESCLPPSSNVSTLSGDCADLDPTRFPGAWEGCAPVDADCDGRLPDDDAWYDPLWPVRVPVEVRRGSDLSAPLVSVEIDVAGALGAAPFDPRAVAVVVQDCAAGARRLDAAVTDGLGELFATDPERPVGDGRYGVHVRLDRDLVAGEPVQLAVYLGGPIRSETGALSARADGITWSQGEVAFDALRGGRLDVGASGPWASASLATAGNGGRVGGVWGELGPPVVEVLDAGPRLGVVAVQASDGWISQRWLWFAFEGAPLLYGRRVDEAEVDLILDEHRPLQWVPGTLSAAVGSVVGPSILLEGAEGWVEARWGDPPDVVGAGCDGEGCWLAGSERPLPRAVPAGARVVDDRVVVVGFGAGARDPLLLDDAVARPLVTVGDPETP